MGGAIDKIFGGGGMAASQAMQEQLQRAMQAREQYGQQAEGALNPYFRPGQSPLGLDQYQGQINKLLNPT
ncbi:MAG TPA: hypothetical protein VNU45_17875, partial [Rummeliibacillus sp.]|nr:hypothetical protein [Rummeliibacillus sp.]